MVKAICKGQVIAESDETVVVEGKHYFPRSSVRPEVLQDSATTSYCGWKGTANYHHVVIDGDVHQDVAWFYAQPKSEAENIRDLIAFWKDVTVE